jgi:hypothetical protein
MMAIEPGSSKATRVRPLLRERAKDEHETLGETGADHDLGRRGRRRLAGSAGCRIDRTSGVTGEVCFSLPATPLLPLLGAVRVSAYSAAAAVPDAARRGPGP